MKKYIENKSITKFAADLEAQVNKINNTVTRDEYYNPDSNEPNVIRVLVEKTGRVRFANLDSPGSLNTAGQQIISRGKKLMQRGMILKTKT